MSIYSKKQRWKLMLFMAAVIIGSASLLYTNYLVDKLDQEERKKIELWAEATYQLANSGMGPVNNALATRIIQENSTIPIILTNEVGEIIGSRNIHESLDLDTKHLQMHLERMKNAHNPIQIEVKMNNEVILTQYLYYEDSYLLKQLRYYPALQLLVIFLFILVSYIAFSRSRRSEQNQVWAGMAKETAHQIGTPLSSIMAWIEILRSKPDLDNITTELDKDVKRLETITERFSKIGSKPKLQMVNISDVLMNTVNYLQHRLSDKVTITLKKGNAKLYIPINAVLFEWVIENICKNAVDAMKGEGQISIDLFETDDYLKIHISDTGKGIPKNAFKSIFKPGFTSKKRGWGLGLSLTKRIIEDYHSGRIYVKSSKINKGSTFCISMHKR
ncbi:MAG: ATP-binding protein [Flavobacteriales bacterium]|nr:ATP-binding protein [Flavobacteriales bacterium]